MGREAGHCALYVETCDVEENLYELGRTRVRGARLHGFGHVIFLTGKKYCYAGCVVCHVGRTTYSLFAITLSFCGIQKGSSSLLAQHLYIHIF